LSHLWKNVTDKTTGEVVGYTIHFSKSSPITIYHGKDGAKGDKGDSGINGTDGHTPVIGVTQIDGIYYWTVDGTALKDASGNNVPASRKGAQGEPGATPQIRINNGRWEVSIDEGKTWSDLGSAESAGSTVPGLFSEVKETSAGVVFKLTDGSAIIIPKEKAFGIVVDNSKAYDVVAGSSTEIEYSVNAADDNTVVDAFASGNWSAEAVATDISTGVIKVSVPEDGGDKGKVLVFATNGAGKTDIKTLNFNKGTLTYVGEASSVPAEGGEVPVAVTSNINFTAEVAEDAVSWLSIAADTRTVAMRTENFIISVSANNTPYQRTGEINLIDENGSTVQQITVVQETNGEFTEPTFTCSEFEYYITSNFDTDKDGKISKEEAAKVKEIKINDNMYYIKSFDGIEAFFNLESFSFTGSAYYSQNSTFTTLDLSKNTSLKKIEVLSKSLQTLKLGELKQLGSIAAGLCSKLESIEYTSLPALTSLIAYSTSLKSIDAAGIPAVETLTLYGSDVQSLDLSANKALKTLSAGCSTLTSLNIAGCTELEELSINGAKIAAIDLTPFTKLTSFSADETPLAEIDLSKAEHLQSLNASYCDNLTIIDASASKELNSMYASSNKILKEVRFAKGVDISSFTFTKGYWTPDETYYTVIIKYLGEDAPEISDYAAGIADTYARNYILKQYDKNSDGQISAEEAAAVTSLDLSYYDLGSTDGLEVFPLEELNLEGNNITEFDGSKFKDIKVLNLAKNKLTQINLKSTTVEEVNLSENQLSGSMGYSTFPYGSIKKLDVSNNTGLSFSPYMFSKLEYLDMSHTAATSVSSYFLTNVKYLSVANTRISGTLDISSLKAIETLDISNTGISSIKIAGSVVSGTLKKVIADGSKLNLVDIGVGNEMPDDLEITGVSDYIVLNFTQPTKELKSNVYGNITEFKAGSKSELKDFTVNYSTISKGFVIEDGGEASIVAGEGKKVVRFFAIAAGDNTELSLERSSGKVIYTKSTDSSSWGSSYKSTDEIPFSVSKNSKIAADGNSFIVEGNTDYHFFNLSRAYSSETSTEAGEEITFKAKGGKVIVFAINLSGSRDDED
jgi:Leucine Rich Repeat.